MMRGAMTNALAAATIALVAVGALAAQTPPPPAAAEQAAWRLRRIDRDTILRYRSNGADAPITAQLLRGERETEVTLPLRDFASGCAMRAQHADGFFALTGGGALCVVDATDEHATVLDVVQLGFVATRIAHRDGVWAALSDLGELRVAFSDRSPLFLPGAESWSAIATPAQTGHGVGSPASIGVDDSGDVVVHRGMRGRLRFRRVDGRFVLLPATPQPPQPSLRVVGDVVLGEPLRIASTRVSGPLLLETIGGERLAQLAPRAEAATQVALPRDVTLEAGATYRLRVGDVRSAAFTPFAVVKAGFSSAGVDVAPVRFAADRVRIEWGRFTVTSRLSLDDDTSTDADYDQLTLVQRGSAGAPRTTTRDGVTFLDADAATSNRLDPLAGAIAAQIPLSRDEDLVGDRVFVQFVVLRDDEAVAATDIAVAQILTDRGALLRASAAPKARAAFSENRLRTLAQMAWTRSEVHDLEALRRQLTKRR